MALVQALFHGYAVAGDPSKLTHGDYYAGKGIGHAILQTSEGLVAVFNTHTCANYAHKYTGVCIASTNLLRSHLQAFAVLPAPVSRKANADGRRTMATA